MNNLKFRAYNTVEKTMGEPFTLEEAIRIRPLVDPTNDCVYMQFTGLHDKNGVEIYFDDYVEDEIGQIWIVKWNKTEISLLNISTGDIMSIRNPLLIKSNLYENTNNFTPKYTEIS